MKISDIEKSINAAWLKRKKISLNTKGEVRRAVNRTIDLLDSGNIRIAEKKKNKWKINQWIKKAILLSFKINDNKMLSGPYGTWFDKVPGKTRNWQPKDWKKAGFRMVPNGVARHGSYVADGVVLMPSFINIGAYVDSGTMIDTWATVGSCAQIGKNCHISGGAGIGGVLEPLQANPVIIEDNCFIGARSEVAEGVIVETGSVLSMGVYVGASTKIYDRENGKVHYGSIPAYSVVVPGTLPSKKGNVNLYCAVIVKKVDQKTRSKTSINELQRN